MQLLQLDYMLKTNSVSARWQAVDVSTGKTLTYRAAYLIAPDWSLVDCDIPEIIEAWGAINKTTAGHGE